MLIYFLKSSAVVLLVRIVVLEFATLFATLAPDESNPAADAAKPHFTQ